MFIMMGEGMQFSVHVGVSVSFEIVSKLSTDNEHFCD